MNDLPVGTQLPTLTLTCAVKWPYAGHPGGLRVLPVLVMFPFAEEGTSPEGRMLSQGDTGAGGEAQAA